jgi:hypothetical protein
MAKTATCHTCVYAHWDVGLWLRTLWSGLPAGPTCGNQPQFPGRMRECPSGPACRNYRPWPPTPTGENVKTIPLTEGFYTYVDAADFEELNQYRWYAYNGYAVRNEKNKRIYMQRQIMQPPKGMVVDHINHNRYDNTRANLRNVTPRENSCNMRKHARAASIYKGVGRDKRCHGWYAKAALMRVPVVCYGFREEAEAARAYDRMAVELFGEVAGLNFPEEWPAELRARVYAEAEAKREALRAKAARAKRRKNGKEKKKKGPRAAACAKPRAGKRPRRASRTRSAE